MRHWWPRALFGGAIAALALAGCTRLELLDMTVPAGDMTAARGIHFGAQPRQALDVYSPNHGSGLRPVVVWYYGGSWQSGRRKDYRFIAEYLTGLGYVTVVPDYRLYPDVTYPAFLEDAAAALAWAADPDHVAPLGGDAQCIVLMGHSAGAYNAAMLAYDRRWADSTSVANGSIKAFVGLAGPYDFYPFDGPTTRAVFGTAPDPLSTQPVNHVADGAPRALLLHGTTDTTVRLRNAQSLADVLRRHGVPVDLEIYDGVDHIRIVSALAEPLRRRDIAGKIAEFLADVVKNSCR